MKFTVTAVVVTHNRQALLKKCLESHMGQTRKPDRILVVDNASSDGTLQMLNTDGWLDRDDVHLLALQDNLGGAGGFAFGLKQAFSSGADWAWIMDDDAFPYPDALERLLKAPLIPANLYASVAVSGDRLAWPLTPPGGGRNSGVSDPALLPERMEVGFAPFLGLLVSRELIERIGVPDASFFIAKDDVEYSYRARHSGSRIEIVSTSRIEHPPAEYHEIFLPFFKFRTLRLAPWKRYYSVRNRIFIARRYHGAALFYATLPGSLLHLFLALLHEPDRRGQVRAFFAGTIDGLLGHGGRRHEFWGLQT